MDGKTDICIKNNLGENLLIAECKIWHGKEHFLRSIDQLLSYLTWRDVYISLIVFVESRDFSLAIHSAKKAVEEHPNFIQHRSSERGNVLSCVIRHPRNEAISINPEIMFFHFPKK